MDILQLVRSVRRFAQQFAYDLPGQQFVERVAAAREVPCLLVSHYSIHPSPLTATSSIHVHVAWQACSSLSCACLRHRGALKVYYTVQICMLRQRGPEHACLTWLML